MNPLFDIFKQKFAAKKIKLSDEKITKFTDDFSAVLFLYILGDTEPRLNTEEINRIKTNLAEMNYRDAIQVLKVKYSPEEWDQLIEKHLETLFNDYLSQVIVKEN